MQEGVRREKSNYNEVENEVCQVPEDRGKGGNTLKVPSEKWAAK